MNTSSEKETFNYLQMQVRSRIDRLRLQSLLFLLLPLLVCLGHLFHRLLESLVQVLSMRRDLLLVVAVHVEKCLRSVHPEVVLGAEKVDRKVAVQMVQVQDVVGNIVRCKDSR